MFKGNAQQMKTQRQDSFKTWTYRSAQIGEFHLNQTFYLKWKNFES